MNSRNSRPTAGQNAEKAILLRHFVPAARVCPV